MGPESERIAHIALRVPLVTSVGGHKFSTVEIHSRIVEARGRVALAKFGQAGTDARVGQLQAQIERGVRTLLILITKREKEFIGYQSELRSVHRGKPTLEILSAAPEYYSQLDLDPQLWFLLENSFKQTDLAKFRLTTTQRPLIDVISECRTSSMLVEETIRADIGCSGGASIQ